MTDTAPPALVFIDTETTSLRPDRLVWDVAWVRRGVDLSYPDGRVAQTREQLYVQVPVDDADLKSLRLGGYYDRHPSVTQGISYPEAYVAKAVERATRDAILIGSNPAFDAECLAPMLRRHGFLPSWHYRTIDVISLAAGYLAGATDIDVDPDDVELARTLPYKSEQIAQALGVEIAEEDRHTARGDALWAMPVWDAVMGS